MALQKNGTAEELHWSLFNTLFTASTDCTKVSDSLKQLDDSFCVAKGGTSGQISLSETKLNDVDGVLTYTRGNEYFC